MYEKIYLADGLLGGFCAIKHQCGQETEESEKVTPDCANSNAGTTANKVAEFKEKDPHGFGMAILGMGIVLSCLLLLSIFFYLFGKIFAKANSRKAEATTQEETPQPQDENEVIAAVICSMVVRSIR